MDDPDAAFTVMAKSMGYEESVIQSYLRVLPPEEAMELLGKNEKGVTKGVRLNSLAAEHSVILSRLRDRNYKLSPVAWLKDGFWLPHKKKGLGSSILYLMGLYFLQSPVSQLVTEVLDPQAGQIVLDIASAPGGKSSHQAQLMDNRGVLICLEPNTKRCRSLVSNMARTGILNAAIVPMTAEEFAEAATSGKTDTQFDRIMLDAPCTGEGLIVEKPERRASRSIEDVEFCAKRQRILLPTAFGLLKPKGILLYGTCSTNAIENEDILDGFLKSTPSARTIAVDRPGRVPLKEEGQHSGVAAARRFFPHSHNTIGFFFCLVEKTTKKQTGEQSARISHVDSDNNDRSSSQPTDKRTPSELRPSSSEEKQVLLDIVKQLRAEEQGTISELNTPLGMRLRSWVLEFQRPMNSANTADTGENSDEQTAALKGGDLTLVTLVDGHRVVSLVDTATYEFLLQTGMDAHVSMLGLPLLVLDPRTDSDSSLRFLPKHPSLGDSACLHPGILHLLESWSSVEALRSCTAESPRFLFGENSKAEVPSSSIGSEPSDMLSLVRSQEGDLVGLATLMMSKTDTRGIQDQVGSDDHRLVSAKNALDLGWYLRKGT